MSRQDHISVELYFRVAAGQVDTAAITQRLHQHLMACCPQCRSAWEALGEQREMVLRMLARTLAGDPAFRQALAEGRLPAEAPVAELADSQASPPRHAPAFSRGTRRLDRDTAALRARRIEARRELRMLLRTPPAERAARVARANTRFRSRAFAEVLLEESRRIAERDPAEALALAELVPAVVYRTPGAEPSDWAAALKRRSRVLGAHARRSAGQRAQAEEEIAALRAELEEVSGVGAVEAAEIDGVEAALRAEQGRFDDAERLLARAADALRAAELPTPLARVLVERGELLRRRGRLEQSLTDLQAARALVDAEAQPFLHVRAAGHLALVLRDLGRRREAEVAWAATRRWRRAADDERWIEEVDGELRAAPGTGVPPSHEPKP